MSAQAGVFYFDSRPVNLELVAAMGRSLDAFGPDRASQHVAPGLAMVHRALHITPEDRHELQPLISTRQSVLTWDGRLDNRHDLLSQLWHDLDDDDESDAALALCVYEKWGIDGFSKLIGDWSLVIWDEEKQRIALASDYMGVRPLHYYLRDDSVWWSTTLQCLVDILGLHDDLEPRFIVGSLGVATPPGITPYKGVLAVPTAQAVVVHRNCRSFSQPFWKLTPHHIRFKHEDDYAIELRRHFMEAVGARLRAEAPVWAQLSGGLDSSCIVCAADVLVHQGAVSAQALRTVSYVTDGSPELDERRFIACVEQQRGATGEHLLLDDSLNLVNESHAWVTPIQPSGSTLTTYRVMRREGARVLLTGDAGDSVMGNCLDYHYDVSGLLQSGHIIQALLLARLRARAARRPVASVMYDAACELLPARTASQQMLLKHLGGSSAAGAVSDDRIADVYLIKPTFAGWWREELLRQLRHYWAFPDVSQRRAARDLLRTAEARHAQCPSDEPSAFVSHPYLHRPLVEYMLSVPATIVAPPGQPRGLMRRAFAPFVPQRIISRISKGYALPFFARNLRLTAAEWLNDRDSFRVAQLECIDRNRLFRYLGAVREGVSKRTDVATTLVKLEQWLRARERRRSGVPASDTDARLDLVS